VGVDIAQCSLQSIQFSRVAALVCCVDLLLEHLAFGRAAAIAFGGQNRGGVQVGGQQQAEQSGLANHGLSS